MAGGCDVHGIPHEDRGRAGRVRRGERVQLGDRELPAERALLWRVLAGFHILLRHF
jgi:hypothetical protein